MPEPLPSRAPKAVCCGSPRRYRGICGRPGICSGLPAMRSIPLPSSKRRDETRVRPGRDPPAEWRLLIDWASLRYDATLAVTSGIVPAEQPPATLGAFAAIVAAQDEFRLTALHTLAAACGSLVIGLALLEGRLDAESAFAASQLD